MKFLAHASSASVFSDEHSSRSREARPQAQAGDRICLDAAGRRLELLVSDEEMARRKSALQLPKMSPNRGYGKLFHDHVVQAPGGVDFDFLQDVDKAEASGDA